jgi:putative hydrolase of HD superfamily
MSNERIAQQLNFLNEIEKLKVVYRRNRTADRSRFENSAEHSWHVAMMALVFAEHSNDPGLDVLKVVKLLLVHDLVEIYAGDTWIYDAVGVETQESREDEAARRLFGLLPPDQAEEFHSLWGEFEERQSHEAKFAAGIDLLQPLANHLLSGSPSDEGPKIAVQSVVQKKSPIAGASSSLWVLAQQIIEQSAKRGLYTP